MKKLIGSIAVVTVIVTGTQILRRHQNKFLISPTEKQALRDAPSNSDDSFGQLTIPKLHLTGRGNDQHADDKSDAAKAAGVSGSVQQNINVDNVTQYAALAKAFEQGTSLTQAEVIGWFRGKKYLSNDPRFGYSQMLYGFRKSGGDLAPGLFDSNEEFFITPYDKDRLPATESEFESAKNEAKELLKEAQMSPATITPTGIQCHCLYFTLELRKYDKYLVVKLIDRDDGKITYSYFPTMRIF